ncbi:hypothetical protein KFU94_26755 [Chloroflexi bacterium TSY]|nr:hypothetical protein [Chloroflexi bacterium TSY]
MQQAISVEQLIDKAMLLNSVQRQTVYEFIDFLLHKSHINGHDKQEQLASLPTIKGYEDSEPKNILRTVPATSLDLLTGIISVGGDALEESEALYDE